MWIIKPPFGAQLDHNDGINDGLVVFWLFNEGSGSIINDISGNYHTGTLYNMASPSGWISSGRLGGAIIFDGIDDYIEANHQLIPNYPFSISAWIRAAPIGIEDYVIFGLTDKNIEHSQYGILLGTDEGGRVGIRDQYKGTESSAYSAINADDNNWYHIVAIYKSATDRSLYINTVLQLTSTTSINYDTNVNRWSIGRWGDLTPKSYFKGAIDEVRVYNRPLTNTEISRLYSAPYSMFLEAVVVTYPKGGETWERGESYNISWSNSVIGGTVRIDMYKGGALSHTINTSAQNDGSYLYITSAESTNTGNDFKIRITNTDGTYGESAGYFTINPAPCTPLQCGLTMTPSGG